MRFSTVLGLGLVLGLALGACGQEGERAPGADAMQRAGEQMEKAAEQAGEAAKSAAEATEEAAKSAMDKAGEAMEQAGEAVQEMAAPADEKGCLDLVAAGNFAEAVPVCTKAVGMDPDNAELQAALEKAKAQAGDATQAAGEAVQDMKPEMP